MKRRLIILPSIRPAPNKAPCLLNKESDLLAPAKPSLFNNTCIFVRYCLDYSFILSNQFLLQDKVYHYIP